MTLKSKVAVVPTDSAAASLGSMCRRQRFVLGPDPRSSATWLKQSAGTDELSQALDPATPAPAAVGPPIKTRGSAPRAYTARKCSSDSALCCPAWTVQELCRQAGKPSGGCLHLDRGFRGRAAVSPRTVRSIHSWLCCTTCDWVRAQQGRA